MITKTNKTAKEYGAQAYKEGLRCNYILDTKFAEEYIPTLPDTYEPLAVIKEWSVGWMSEYKKENKGLEGLKWR